MSYDTTYVTNFPPTADISRHSGLADRKRAQFLCRLRVFRAHIHTAGNRSTTTTNNNTTHRITTTDNDNIIAPKPADADKHGRHFTLAKAPVCELIHFRRAVKMTTMQVSRLSILLLPWGLGGYDGDGDGGAAAAKEE